MTEQTWASRRVHPDTEVMTTHTIAGIAIPDSQLVRDTTEYIRDVEEDLLFDHSRRVFLFGAHRGRQRGLTVDL
jgi:hypothetical protein